MAERHDWFSLAAPTCLQLSDVSRLRGVRASARWMGGRDRAVQSAAASKKLRPMQRSAPVGQMLHSLCNDCAAARSAELSRAEVRASGL